MLNKNAQQFKNYLEDIGFPFSYSEENEEVSIIDYKYQVECGATIETKLVFNENESLDRHTTLIAIYGFVITAISPVKKNYLYELINNLNDKYTYFKYVLHENAILLEAYIPFEDNFNINVVMDLMHLMTQILEEDYVNLMRTIWS